MKRSLPEETTLEFAEVVHSDTTSSMPKGGKFIGAHVSAAGGLWNAFSNSHKIGCHSFAIFVKNQRKWESAPLDKETVAKFKECQKVSKISQDKIIPHGSYLINLGNPDPVLREKSYQSLLDDVRRCEMLGISLYNIHPGSTVGKCTIKESVKYISNAINLIHKEVPRICIVLETMAGQGNVVGSKFEELRDIIAQVYDKDRIGVCIDTCHIFSAGYDIRSAVAYEKTMTNFCNIVGLKYLKAAHINDSKCDLGSGKDRHENIGKGKIGISAFKNIMNDSRFIGIPLILETPLDAAEGEKIYQKEISMLYDLIQD